MFSETREVPGGCAADSCARQLQFWRSSLHDMFIFREDCCFEFLAEFKFSMVVQFQ